MKSLSKALQSFSFTAKTVPIRQTNLLINGKFVKSTSGKTFDTINPATEEKIASVQQADQNDVNKAVAAARHAFDQGAWSKTTGPERARLLNRLADLMEKNKEELAALEALDNGKSFSDALNIDISLAISHIRYFAGWADKFHGGTVYNVPGHLCYTREEPVGVVAGIYAWNFPVVLMVWKLGPILATGCTTVLKPAEQTPLTSLRMGELIQEAGFPEGVVNILSGYGDVGAALVAHPGVDKVSFTGSTDVGREIISKSGSPNIKRITLELGGKSPNIILNDADIDQAVAQAQVSLFLNAGQCCIAGSRCFVQSGIYDKFVEASVKATKARKYGEQFHKDTVQGSQIDKTQQDKIHSYIESGKSEGAKVLAGGNIYKGKGFFVEPTVFADVKDNMKIAKEEIFGPVMSVLKFDTIDEVITRANNTNYGLGAGIVTKSIPNALKLAENIKAGTVYVNCYDVFRPNTPFGGFKDSGLGREHGEHGLRPYLETKTVVIKSYDN